MSILVLTSDTLIGTAATGNIEYNGQFFGTDSAASRAQMQRITQGTAVASTSGTSIDFTSIPAWVKRITVMFAGVSTSSTSNLQVQLGTGGAATTSGYTIYASTISSASISSGGYTSGYVVRIARAAEVASGQFIFTNVSGNTWTGQYFISDNVNAESFIGGGNVTLSGVLNIVRITTVNGTDTFDAGSVNILYEG
jgi:hypothetical protein